MVIIDGLQEVVSALSDGTNADPPPYDLPYSHNTSVTDDKQTDG